MCTIAEGFVPNADTSKPIARNPHLNMPMYEDGDHEAWVTMGYTHAAIKLEYRMYDSKRARSAMAPDTMVHAVAANCGRTDGSVN